ncbi:hypothetical protein F4781DRAFT_427653 [Annulohypoxylon bovei var. microspora]|nr:hypothetical protein F4781DRAFT_427653 [Annulohypoxylon bovei var. microspora]
MLSTYLQSESRRWAAEHHHQQSYPASTSPSQNESSYEDSDCESIFSRTSSASRRSSISSIASEDEAALVAFDQPRDVDGAPITMYASLDQAVAQSTQTLEAEGPRRLVTPGKLYENEDDDDEIVEEEDAMMMTMMTQRDDSATTQHHLGGLTRAFASSVAAAG